MGLGTNTGTTAFVFDLGALDLGTSALGKGCLEAAFNCSAFNGASILLGFGTFDPVVGTFDPVVGTFDPVVVTFDPVVKTGKAFLVKVTGFGALDRTAFSVLGDNFLTFFTDDFFNLFPVFIYYMDIYLFHRDLRIIDNNGLNPDYNLVPIFIFTPEQIEPSKNKYFSNNAVQFMCECLDDLKKSVPELYLFYGDTIKTLQKIHKKVGIKSLHFNLDYTPYARRRDDSIFDFCTKHNIECFTYEDYLLAPMGSFLKKDGNPYVVYGPFKDTIMSSNISKPTNTKPHFIKCPELNTLITKRIFYKNNPDNLVKGGRDEALKKLNFTHYEHNKLSNSTTHLSAYIKYGCISIREAYYANTNITYRQQLIWREFYYYIGVYFPDVIDKSKNFQSKYDGIQWSKSEHLLIAWQKGETGYPIIDACMRELNTTGYMHNRGRLISSNFLNRILNMDWRLGELYFAQQLIDYDPLVNNGNWQWIASTGTDTKPYFQRLFNPWLQGQRFDPNCEYIKKWLPELKDVSSKDIHNWEKYHNDRYIKPIINYEDARKKSIETYKKILS